ncbi:hypothetical protein [Vogesella indigofera]|uniref:hypothetical protein n=1 Tax=Vogesella indigofera TaxID=45465 RepID=UPI0035B47758
MTPQSKRRLLRIYSRVINSPLVGAIPFFVMSFSFVFIFAYTLGIKTADVVLSAESRTLQSVVEACRK